MALVPQRAVAFIPCGLWNPVGKALKRQDSKPAHSLGDLELSNTLLGSHRWVALPLSDSKRTTFYPASQLLPSLASPDLHVEAPRVPCVTSQT